MKNVLNSSVNKNHPTSWSKPAKIALITIVALLVIGAIAASVISTPIGGMLFSLAVWKFSSILSGSGATIIALIAAISSKTLSNKSVYVADRVADTPSSSVSTPATLAESKVETPITRPEGYYEHERQILIDVNRGVKLSIQLGSSPSLMVRGSQVKASVACLYDKLVSQFRDLHKEAPEEDALKVLSFCHQAAFAPDLTCMRKAVAGYNISALPRPSPQESLPRDMSIDIALDDLGNCSVRLRKEQPCRGVPEDESLSDKYFQISYSAYIPNIFASLPERHRTLDIIEPEDQSPVAREY